MSALSRIGVTRPLGQLLSSLSNNWEVNKGRVSTHTSGHIREAECVLLNP